MIGVIYNGGKLYIETNSWSDVIQNSNEKMLLINLICCVANQLYSLMPNDFPQKNILFSYWSKDYPISCAKRNNVDCFSHLQVDVDYHIKITAVPTFWCNIVFQIAHEICHAFMDNLPNIKKFNWISESICELASIDILYNIDKNLYNYYSYYCNDNIFKKYVDDLIFNPIREIVTKESNIQNIFSIEELEKDPYGPSSQDYRWRNVVIANHIWKTTAINPKSWKAISKMSDYALENENSIIFLENWLKKCNKDEADFVLAFLDVVYCKSEFKIFC